MIETKIKYSIGRKFDLLLGRHSIYVEKVTITRRNTVNKYRNEMKARSRISHFSRLDPLGSSLALKSSEIH